MRVLIFLAKSVLIVAVVAGVGFLLAREVLLQLGISQLHQSVSTMRKAWNKSGPYLEACRAKGVAPLSGSYIEEVRLRFTSDTEYKVEVVCAQYNLDPIVIETKTLPQFVKKEAGRSGIIWGSNLSGVTLELWQRRRGIFVDNFEIHGGVIVKAEQLAQPKTSCQGYGYSCCQIESSVGEGGAFSVASDCPFACFASCRPRPVVLSVATQPFYDPKTRVLEVKSGEPVEFNYVVDGQGVDLSEVVVDFGDGRQESLSGEVKGQTSHVYSCAQTECHFVAGVVATNVVGDAAVPTNISRVKVVVR